MALVNEGGPRTVRAPANEDDPTAAVERQSWGSHKNWKRPNEGSSSRFGATGPRGCGFEPGQGDEFLRAITIRSTSKVKLEVSCRKILLHVKELPGGRID
jgi:hypothetical protein